MQRTLLLNGKTHCAFDELSYDVPQNRILKATLHNLTLVSALNPDEKRRTEHLYRKLDAVSHVRLTGACFVPSESTATTGSTAWLLHLCRIIHENLLVNEEEGTAQFIDFRDDKHQMGLVFQQFVKAFCKRETHYEVSAPQIDWVGTEGSETDLRHLSRMHTDIMLRSPERTIIVDTKFYKNPLNTRFGEERVHSDHL